MCVFILNAPTELITLRTGKLLLILKRLSRNDEIVCTNQLWFVHHLEVLEKNVLEFIENLRSRATFEHYKLHVGAMPWTLSIGKQS